MISSRQNPLFREAVRLRNSSGNRRESGLFLIDGPREIKLAMEAGFELTHILSGPIGELSAESKDLLTVSPQTRAVEFAPQLMEKLSYGQKSTDMVAIAICPELKLERLPAADLPLQLVLERPEKPGNVGACIRSASAAGATAVILVEPICEPFNPNLIRASRGTVFTVPLAVCSLDQFRAFYEENDTNLFNAVVDGDTSLWECDFTQTATLAFGNEAQGLTTDFQSLGSTRFRIPMVGAADSLNLSISSALSLYEARRQRTDPPK
ncbi:MAG: TrmH family RNA methyltransferase [Aureliella sp.]